MSFIEFIILVILASVLVMMWGMKNQGQMIMDKMNEMIKATKDERPTPSAPVASSAASAVSAPGGISNPDLTPAQLEMRIMRHQGNQVWKA